MTKRGTIATFGFESLFVLFKHSFFSNYLYLCRRRVKKNYIYSNKMERDKAPTDSWDEMKRLMVVASAKVFHRYGYKKTTMDDLAKVIKRGKSSIYYYFKNKEELFEAVIEMEIEHLKTLLATKLKPSDSPEEKLTTYIVTRMQVIKKLINFWEVKNIEQSAGIEFLERLRKKYDAQEIDFIVQILEEGIEKDIFRSKNPRLSAIAIATAMKGLESPLFQENYADSEQETQIREIIQILFYGLVKRAAI